MKLQYECLLLFNCIALGFLLHSRYQSLISRGWVYMALSHKTFKNIEGQTSTKFVRAQLSVLRKTVFAAAAECVSCFEWASRPLSTLCVCVKRERLVVLLLYPERPLCPRLLLLLLPSFSSTFYYTTTFPPPSPPSSPLFSPKYSMVAASIVECIVAALSYILPLFYFLS